MGPVPIQCLTLVAYGRPHIQQRVVVEDVKRRSLSSDYGGQSAELRRLWRRPSDRTSTLTIVVPAHPKSSRGNSFVGVGSVVVAAAAERFEGVSGHADYGYHRGSSSHSLRPYPAFRS
ncbi:hypothetical protein RB195_015433 [Necator americanus]|uniref:Uncharacterized protein n=1 Tax=Necator americanus TaxID=51031 RepID=A0ABR1E4P6_NECAM